MASPSYGIDVVALAFSVILAAALALLLSHLLPQLSDLDDAAGLETWCRLPRRLRAAHPVAGRCLGHHGRGCLAFVYQVMERGMQGP